MGQYHMAVCVDTGEALDPHGMGQGLKLLAQGWGGWGGTTTGLALLIAPGGSWHGKRIALIGDYAEVGDLPAGVPYADNPVALYGGAGNDPGAFTDRICGLIGEAFGISYTGDGWRDTALDLDLMARLGSATHDDNTFGPLYVVNHTTGEHLDPHHFGAGRNLAAIALRQGGVMLAVMVLLAASNGRGGGDLRVPDGDPAASVVGSWAGHVVTLGPAVGEDITADVAGLLERCGERSESDAPWEMGALPRWVVEQRG